MTDFLKVFGLTSRRKLLALFRNRSGFVFSMVQLLTFILALFLFAPFYRNQNIQTIVGTSNVLAYILLGGSFVPVIGLSIWNSAGEFVEEFSNRLIEVVIISPISKFAYIVGNIGSSGVVLGVNFLPIFVIALALSKFLTMDKIMVACALAIVTFVNIMAFGAIITGLLIIFRRIAGIFGVIHTALQFLTGILVPVVLMPRWLQLVAALLPGTAGIDLVRWSVLGSATIFDVPAETCFLVVQTLVFIGLSRVIIAVGLRRGYTNGYS